MIGIIPSGSNTYEVNGDFNESKLIEGHLYWDPNTYIIYYYSTIKTRPSPETGYFPIWNGKEKFQTPSSKIKKYPDDILNTDTQSLAKSLDNEIAKKIEYFHRKMDRDKLLKPEIHPKDNMFTQCIKGVINKMEVTMPDLIEMAHDQINEHVLYNCYTSLNNINMMRQERWLTWMNAILHLTYKVSVSKDMKTLISYDSVTDTIDTGMVQWEQLVNSRDDPFKKICKILKAMLDLDKAALKRPEINPYTINNLLTAIKGNKLLSAELFSRFIHMADLSCNMLIYKDEELYFQFHE